MDTKKISESFIQHAANILGDTYKGLTTYKIIKSCNEYAVEYNVQIPYCSIPKMGTYSNKRTLLEKNLLEFSPKQQFKIIMELSESIPTKEAEDLRCKLCTQYPQFNENSISEEPLVCETKSLLDNYPKSKEWYDRALNQFENKLFNRECLDNMRLALELLLKDILHNDKSLENQQSYIGKFLKEKGCSPEITNMFPKLVDYYTKYQNAHVKHGDSANENDIEFIINLSTSFMQQFIKLNNK